MATLEMAYDWVVTHTLQKSAMCRSCPDPAIPLADSESKKVSYARSVCASAGIDFLPLAVDTFGGFGMQADAAIGEVAKHALLLRGPSAPPASHIRQRLQVAVFQGVARQLLRRITHCEDEDLEEAWCSDCDSEADM